MQPINSLQDLFLIEFDHRAVFADYLEGIKLGTEVGIKIIVDEPAHGYFFANRNQHLVFPSDRRFLISDGGDAPLSVRAFYQCEAAPQDAIGTIGTLDSISRVGQRDIRAKETYRF